MVFCFLLLSGVKHHRSARFFALAGFQRSITILAGPTFAGSERPDKKNGADQYKERRLPAIAANLGLTLRAKLLSHFGGNGL